MFLYARLEIRDGLRLRGWYVTRVETHILLPDSSDDGVVRGEFMVVRLSLRLA